MGSDQDNSALRHGLGVLTKEAELQQQAAAAASIGNCPLWVPDVGLPSLRNREKNLLAISAPPTPQRKVLTALPCLSPSC